MSNISFLAKIVNIILKKTKPGYMTSEEKIKLFLESTKDKTVRTLFHSADFNDMKLVTFGDRYGDSNLIIYVHGGAYTNQLNYQHTLYCFILSKILKRRVIAPAYPLTPEHNCKESYKLITDLYSELIEEYEHVTLMGDSAGGGFVLSFCQYIKTLDIKLPDNIIVFSPWVDITMRGNYDDSNDPILGNIGLKEIGKRWADDLKTTDYRVSPLYGDNKNLPRTLIFTGTDEIFYNDIKNYYEKLVNDRVDAELVVGDGLFHIYPMFPIPEAIGVIKKIKKEIGN